MNRTQKAQEEKDEFNAIFLQIKLLLQLTDMSQKWLY